MYVVLEFPVRSKLHSTHDSDHRSGVRAEKLCQSAHTEENKLARPFEGGTNNGLPFRAQKAEASRRAHDRNLTRDFPPRFHRAQKHVGKQHSCQPREGPLTAVGIFWYLSSVGLWKSSFVLPKDPYQLISSWSGRGPSTCSHRASAAQTALWMT